jgi:Cu/Zn superoxide dismutase
MSKIFSIFIALIILTSCNISSDLWCLGCGEENDLLDQAVIIHNGQDDYVSQPSGASGMRIGCMEINIPEELSMELSN